MLLGLVMLVTTVFLIAVMVVLLVSEPLSIPLFLAVLVVVAWLVRRSERR